MQQQTSAFCTVQLAVCRLIAREPCFSPQLPRTWMFQLLEIPSISWKINPYENMYLPVMTHFSLALNKFLHTSSIFELHDYPV